jgi:integrase
LATIERRLNQDGVEVFRVRVRRRGEVSRTATFPRKTDAKRWGNQLESEILSGRYFYQSESQRHTVQELIDRYLSDVLPGKAKKTQKDQRQQLSWWGAALGHLRIADLTPTLIVECKSRLGLEKNSRRSSSTVKRYLAALSHVLVIGVREYGWLNENPMVKVSKPKEGRGRSRYLSDEERERLLAACRKSSCPYLFTIVVLAISTGARKSELTELKWGQIDFKNSRIQLNETKNGECRPLALVNPAYNLMRELAKVRRIDTQFVFPNDSGAKSLDIRTAWEFALKRAKITDFRFHDLRHTCASYLAMDGASGPEIAAVLGHKTLAMVKRYAHIGDSHVAGVVEKMNNKIFCQIS